MAFYRLIGRTWSSCTVRRDGNARSSGGWNGLAAAPQLLQARQGFFSALSHRRLQPAPNGSLPQGLAGALHWRSIAWRGLGRHGMMVALLLRSGVWVSGMKRNARGGRRTRADDGHGIFRAFFFFLSLLVEASSTHSSKVMAGGRERRGYGPRATSFSTLLSLGVWKQSQACLLIPRLSQLSFHGFGRAAGHQE